MECVMSVALIHMCCKYAKIMKNTETVVQLVERQIVVLVVAGSSPVSLPRPL